MLLTGLCIGLIVCAGFLLYAQWASRLYIGQYEDVVLRGVGIVGSDGAPYGLEARNGWIRVPALDRAAAAQLSRLDWRPCDREYDSFFCHEIHAGSDLIEVTGLYWDSPDGVPSTELFRHGFWGWVDRAVFHSTDGDALATLLIIDNVFQLRCDYQNPHIEVPRNAYLYHYACTRVFAAKYGLAWDSWLSDQDAADLLPTARRYRAEKRLAPIDFGGDAR